MSFSPREVAAARHAKKVLDQSVSWPDSNTLGSMVTVLSEAVLREHDLSESQEAVSDELAKPAVDSTDELKVLLERWVGWTKPSLTQHRAILPSTLERVLSDLGGENREVVICLIWWYLYQKQQVATREHALGNVLYGDQQHLQRKPKADEQNRPDDQAASARLPDAV